MGHKSEGARPLGVRELVVKSREELISAKRAEPGVWFFILPYDPFVGLLDEWEKWGDAFKAFVENCDVDSVICILGTAPSAAALWSKLEHTLEYQLWVTVKLSGVREREGELPNQHCELLILTKYRGSLKHTKTRVAYTYCPYCERTTKDYGGKKHTYHEYGTLMSDVWRDICCDIGKYPDGVVKRLRDLFGLARYRSVYAVDLREAAKGKDGSPRATRDRREGLVEGKKLMRRRALFNGDCLEVLADIADESVDFCFADPPYNLSKRYENWDDALEVKEYFAWCDKWLGELARVLKPGRTLAVVNIPKWAIRHYSYLRTVLHYQNWIVWEGLSLPVRRVMPANYAIVCFSKGGARELPGKSRDVSALDERELLSLREFYCIRTSCVRERELFGVDDRVRITDLWWDIHRLKHNSRRVDHPCQLPPALMRRLIALYTRPGECVLDPFNGVGTTTLAAEELGRFFVGVELSEAYHATAKERHAELRRGLDPFRKRQSTPKAKNSRVQRLKKQVYAVSKKKLQLEVKRIAKKLQRIPSHEDVERMSKYPICYYDEYFVSWGEVCAAARTTGMSEVRKVKPREEHPSLF